MNTEKFNLKYGATTNNKRQDNAMQKFRYNRLGAFIHWGLYAIPAGVWENKIYHGAAEWLIKQANVPSHEWMKLMDEFNPVNFNAKKWANMALNMGVKYVKITTKHHEGFCLWPSEYTKYNIINTPYKKNVLKELVNAYNEVGIDVHFYFSFLDFSHPDYRSKIENYSDKKAFDNFLIFTTNQLKELATQFPSVKDFWFDGTWEESLKQNGWWTYETEIMLKKLIPGVTINSRLRADDNGSRHFDSNNNLMGDYESGYERKLPNAITDINITNLDWEACMTIPENQWGYHCDWSLSYVKKPIEILKKIIHAVSLGGNMVVNFGPKADGSFRNEEIEVMQYIGDWTKEFGECIYGCGYAGLPKQDWGYFTKKDNDIYMIIFNMPISMHLNVSINPDYILNKATLYNETELAIIETTKNEYIIDLTNINIQFKKPFTIKINIIKDNNINNDKYVKALV